MGIAPIKEAAALNAGRLLHEDLAAIAEMEDLTPNAIGDVIDQLRQSSSPPFQSQADMEVLTRRLGWLAASALYLEPSLRKDYENIQVESEIILDRTPLWVAVTPDRLLRHRQGGYLVYKEYKSTITAGQKWSTHWPYAVQVHIGLKAIEEEFQEKPAFGQIVGMMKGDMRDGRLAHPYVWAYRRGDEWTGDYSKARSAGWDHAPIWEYPGGVMEWVQKLGPDVAKSQFPHSMPIFCNDFLLDSLITSRTARQEEIERVADECQTNWDTRVVYFEPRFEQCRPAFGDACPFLACCHNASVNANPLANGEYKVREPHHEVEIQYLKGLI